MIRQVGFIGLGAMGFHMVGNMLKKGYPGVMVANRSRREIVEQLEALGACGTSKEELAKHCDVICICVPTGAVSKEILFGENGISDQIAPGSTVVEFGSLAVSESRFCWEELNRRGIGYIDCPVSGAPGLASAGELAMMAGGEPEVYAKVEPLLQCCGTPVLTGGPGSGCVTKYISQALCAATEVMIGEMFYLGASAGLDLEKAYEAIRRGGAGSMLLDRCLPMIAKRDFGGGAFVGTVYKDLKQIAAFAHEQEVPVPMIGMLTEVFKIETRKGRGRDDISSMIRYYEDLCGRAYDSYRTENAELR